MDFPRKTRGNRVSNIAIEPRKYILIDKITYRFLMKIIPNKLKSGDWVRVIAPARSLAMPWITQELKTIAIKNFKDMGLLLSFSDHVNEIDSFSSSSIQSRITDIHDAFRDPSIQLIIAVIGGFNSNQLLDSLDYNLIRTNPKILCGYSDITALANAIYAKTWLITYSWPFFTSFGNQKNLEYTIEYFKKCLFDEVSFDLWTSDTWSDDKWMLNQENRNFIQNEGHWIINPWNAEGTIIGGNQCTLNLLQGTQYMPDIGGSILFLEDDYEAHIGTIDRDLQSLIHQPWFEKVQAIVFGRFQTASNMTRDILTQIVQSKKELKNIPIIANVDFWHTTPMITFPIGWTARIISNNHELKITIVDH